MDANGLLWLALSLMRLPDLERTHFRIGIPATRVEV
jgi:hypothetical protein